MKVFKAIDINGSDIVYVRRWLKWYMLVGRKLYKVKLKVKNNNT